jgi:cytidylate kinase
MSQKTIIDVVGLPGCGKSAICTYMCEKYGFILYRPSDVIREYAKQNNITLANRQDYIECHKALMEADPYAMIRPAMESDSERVCMDGMRAPIPFLKLRDEYSAKLIYMDCPIELRFERVVADTSRSGHRVQPTLEAFKADEMPDYANPNRHLPNDHEMKQLADYVLDASQTPEAEKNNIDAFLASIGITSTNP